MQEHHPFRLGFGFTPICIMIVYENVLKLVRIEAGVGIKIIDFQAF